MELNVNFTLFFWLITFIFHDIAKLSPSFSFSWAELVFNLNFAPPAQEKYQNGQIQPDLVKQS